MKPRSSIRRNCGLSLFEVLVVIATIFVLAALLLPMLAHSRRRTSQIRCVNCLKQVALSYRIWAGDNDDLYPMMVPVAAGGAKEMVATGDVVTVFQVMSNELSTPKILVCPEDSKHFAATNFSHLAATNLSYFVGLNTDTNYSPNLILSGDANLTLSGRPVKSGLLDLTTVSPVRWDGSRHKWGGNVGMNDGSVQSMTPAMFKSSLSGTGLATNRLAIP